MEAKPRMAIVSYWSSQSPFWDQVPANSIVIINPDSGILQPPGGKTTTDPNKPVTDIADWIALFQRLRANKDLNLTILGYVPTGYFDHRSQNCGKCKTEARIKLQVATYYELMPQLDGIFYDEAAPDDGYPGQSYTAEYEMIRRTNLANKLTVFNPGTWSMDAVAATKAGEHLVTFESTADHYKDHSDEIKAASLKAREAKIIVWHLIYSAKSKDKLLAHVCEMKDRGADFGYIVSEDNNKHTWDKPPKYWEREKAAFSNASAPCP
jgi:hypothetical protein